MKVALFPLMALFFLFTSCGSLKELADGLERPSASVVDYELSDLSLDAAEVVFDIRIKNPYRASLPLVNLNYELASQGDAFLSGEADVAGSIPAKKSKIIQVPARIAFPELLETLTQIRPGQVLPLGANFTLSVDAPVAGRLQLPLRSSFELPIPTLPEIDIQSIKWDDFGLTEISARMNLRIHNLNEFPLDLEQLTYGLTLGGSEILSSQLREATSLNAQERGKLSIPLAFSPVNLGSAVLNMLKGEGATYALEGDMNLTTPYGDLTSPFTAIGETIFR